MPGGVARGGRECSRKAPWSIVYRTYASIQAQEILRFLTPFLPPTLHRMAPGRSSSSVWWTLIYGKRTTPYLECRCGDSPCMLAYRPPLLKPGLQELLSSREGSRYVKARALPCWPPAGAEGDPMSCIAMQLLNIAHHAFLRRVSLVSFVDNYEVLASEPSEAVRAEQAVRRFCSAWDIQLDDKKTVFWALSPGQRKELRASGCQVVSAMRDFGGQLQFTGQFRNKVLIDCMKGLEPMWTRLRLSAAGYPAKLRVLRSSAWPKGLYASWLCHLGDQHFRHLRASALRSLGHAKSGANPMLHPSLVEHPRMDPEFVAIRDSVFDLRLHSSLDLAGPPGSCSAMPYLSRPHRGLPAPGSPPGLGLGHAKPVCGGFDISFLQTKLVSRGAFALGDSMAKCGGGHGRCEKGVRWTPIGRSSGHQSLV